MSNGRPNYCRECSLRLDKITWAVVKEQQAAGAGVQEVRAAVMRRLSYETVNEAEPKSQLCSVHRSSSDSSCANTKHWSETE